MPGKYEKQVGQTIWNDSWIFGDYRNINTNWLKPAAGAITTLTFVNKAVTLTSDLIGDTLLVTTEGVDDIWSINSNGYRVMFDTIKVLGPSGTSSDGGLLIIHNNGNAGNDGMDSVPSIGGGGAGGATATATTTGSLGGGQAGTSGSSGGGGRPTSLLTGNGYAGASPSTGPSGTVLIGTGKAGKAGRQGGSAGATYVGGTPYNGQPAGGATTTVAINLPTIFRLLGYGIITSSIKYASQAFTRTGPPGGIGGTGGAIGNTNGSAGWYSGAAGGGGGSGASGGPVAVSVRLVIGRLKLSSVGGKGGKGGKSLIPQTPAAGNWSFGGGAGGGGGFGGNGGPVISVIKYADHPVIIDVSGGDAGAGGDGGPALCNCPSTHPAYGGLGGYGGDGGYPGIHLPTDLGTGVVYTVIANEGASAADGQKGADVLS